MIKIVSWNINGIRAAINKGFCDWLERSNPDIVGLQEVRARLEQIPSTLTQHQSYNTSFQSALRPGYSGVGLLSKVSPDEIHTSLGSSVFDDEGRLQIARFRNLWIANVYFPNGSGKERDNSRIPYKLEFYQKLFDLLKKLNAEGKKILVLGDFNTAHQEIDLARPKANVNTSGFCQVERDELTRWLKKGFVDTYRHFHGETIKYTWWSNRSGARSRNIGWRIDYVLASKPALPFLQDAFICDSDTGSDHCPIGVYAKSEIFD